MKDTSVYDQFNTDEHCILQHSKLHQVFTTRYDRTFLSSQGLDVPSERCVLGKLIVEEGGGSALVAQTL